MYPLTNKRYYYASGNTAKGLINFLHTNIHNIDQVFVLHHPSHLMKTNILKQMIDEVEEKYELEIIYSPFGREFLEGIVVREKSLAIITDTITTDQIKHTEDILIPSQEKIFHHEKKKEKENREKAYHHLGTALSIHDDLEKIYIREMDFSKADHIAENFIHKLLANVSKENQSPHIYRRMFGATTADGAVNIVPQIIENLSQRVYIKGRAGTGKSVFMNKVAKACEDHGFDIEIYHCSFDPESIDMVLVPELDFCIFDSTSPHEYNAERDKDKVIDLYKETVTPGVDERFSKEIGEITNRYKSFVKKGIKSLQKAKFWQDEIEKNFMTVDQREIQKVISDLIRKIR